MISTKLNKTIQLLLSTGENINFEIGHKNYSLSCDFMECEYECTPNNLIEGDEISRKTYTKNYITINIEKILKRIKDLYREHYIYEKTELIKRINSVKTYSIEQIYMALDILLKNNNEYLIDIFNKTGRLINIGDYYLFQPVKVDDKRITTLERRKPIDFKSSKIIINKIPELASKTNTDIIDDEENYLTILKNEYNLAINKQP